MSNELEPRVGRPGACRDLFHRRQMSPAKVDGYAAGRLRAASRHHIELRPGGARHRNGHWRQPGGHSEIKRLANDLANGHNREIHARRKVIVHFHVDVSENARQGEPHGDDEIDAADRYFAAANFNFLQTGGCDPDAEPSAVKDRAAAVARIHRA